MLCMCGLSPGFKVRFIRNPTKDSRMRRVMFPELTFLLFACIFVLNSGGSGNKKKKHRKSYDYGGDTPDGLPKTPVCGSIILIDNVLLKSFDPFHFNLSRLKKTPPESLT